MQLLEVWFVEQSGLRRYQRNKDQIRWFEAQWIGLAPDQEEAQMIDDPKDRRPQQQQSFSPSEERGRYREGLGNRSAEWLDESQADESSPGDDQVNQAKRAAMRAVDDEKSALARQLRGLASAVEKVGSELRQSEQPALGRYTQQIGNSIGRLARDCENRELGEIAAMAEDFGRKQPLAFLGIAAIAGLAASRFLSASAERSHITPNVAQPNSAATHRKEGDWDFEKELRDA
ncbi:nutrient deprivation-induced protein [Ensifer sp. ENS10]|uniref:nutrient deprivation-induced protein n=1 Tax=Ensifer sp. ENS10 TaxID=2769286 RepID=UPI00177D00A2|nr:nutrient deprivation-induced protein [Ensifer sp. ENS10]MBD9511190.1 nutrient deprivation-induced protein [Ensifer sp. ENS10]